MNDHSNYGLVPKLRFPEFQELGQWNLMTLDDVCEMQPGKFIAALDIYSTYTPGLYPCYGGNGRRGFTKNFNRSGRYSLIGRQGALCGNVSHVTGNFFATEHAVVTTPKRGNCGDWLYQTLCHLNLNRFATGQAQPGLSIDVLKMVNCVVPPCETEQQKIANCLMSLDELIKLEIQNLDELKLHKKGLLQLLFPSEGKTFPKLRFPEYCEASEWEVKHIDDISETITTGGTPSTWVKEYWDGDIRWMNSGELNYKKVWDVKGRITEEGLVNSSTKIIPMMSVLIGLAGQGKTRGTVAMNMIELCINQSIAAIFPNERMFSSDFLYHSLDRRYYELRNLSTGGEGRGGLNLQIIKSLPIQLPQLTEQHKIAYVLTSIDELIAAQVQEISILKCHKKALLQQLFPKLDELYK